MSGPLAEAPAVIAGFAACANLLISGGFSLVSASPSASPGKSLGISVCVPALAFAGKSLGASVWFTIACNDATVWGVWLAKKNGFLRFFLLTRPPSFSLHYWFAHVVLVKTTSFLHTSPLCWGSVLQFPFCRFYGRKQREHNGCFVTSHSAELLPW